MSLLTINWREGQFVDDRSDKFYRVYELGPRFGHLTQYGRTGTTGSFQLKSGSGANTFNGKLRKGYTEVSVGNFQLDDTRIADALSRGGDKVLGNALDNLRRGGQSRTVGSVPTGSRGAAAQPAPRTPTTTRSATTKVTEVDRFELHREAALKAITLAAIEPAKAMQEYARLQEDHKVMEEAVAESASYLQTLELLVGDALAG